jgi:hypothetical protein
MLNSNLLLDAPSAVIARTYNNEFLRYVLLLKCDMLTFKPSLSSLNMASFIGLHVHVTSFQIATCKLNIYIRKLQSCAETSH